MRVVCFIFIFWCSIVLMGQTTVDEKINNYKQLLKEYAQESKLAKNKASITEDEVKQAARIIYEAYTADPVKLTKEISEEVKKAREESKGDVRKYGELFNRTFGPVERRILELIKERYSPLIHDLIKTPLIIKAKIISKETVKEFADKDKPSSLSFNVNYCKIFIEDIIKSNSFINIGDTIEILYAPHWGGNQNIEWLEGESYLLNLEYRINDDKEDISIITYLDENKGFFPVQNDVLIDKTNYFNQGNEVAWPAFKEKILSTINSVLY